MTKQIQDLLDVVSPDATYRFPGQAVGVDAEKFSPSQLATLLQSLITIAQSQVTNLTTDLAAKAPLASPALTGTPTAPTAAGGTNTTQLATTAFVLANTGTAATFNGAQSTTVANSAMTSSAVMIASVSITPRSASASVMVTASIKVTKDTGTTSRTLLLQLRRGTNATDPQVGADAACASAGIASSLYGGAIVGIDAPATTSAVSYSIWGTASAATSSTASSVSITVLELFG